MITAAQLRAARALLGIDQRKLAELSGLSLPTIQRMEASDGVIRGNVDSLMKLVAALDAGGIELIADNATSAGGGRGVRLKRPAGMTLIDRFVVCGSASRDRRRRSVDRARGGGEFARLWPVRRRGVDLAVCRVEASARRGAGREPGRCRSAFHGSARISASTRCRRSFSPSSISAPSRRACSRSAMAATRTRRCACCRSIRRFSPA